MTYSAEQIEAVQNVVDRVGENWDAATTDTVEEKLGKALRDADLRLEGDDEQRLAQAIRDNRGTVEAASVLGA